MGKTKAQSAIEFLMTYGWALLVIIIVFSALYVMGIFKPQIVSRCAFGPEMTCVSFSIRRTTTGNINATLIVQHSQQQAITLKEISCVRSTTINYSSVPAAAKQSLSISLDPGALSAALPGRLCFDQTGSPSTGNAGDPFIGKVFIKWRIGTTGYIHTAEAYVSGPIEPS